MKLFSNHDILLILLVCLSVSGVLFPDEIETAVEISISDSMYVDSLNVKEQLIDSLYYSADSVKYDSKKEQIDLMGHAKVKYHTSNIQAEEISINLQTEQAYSTGESMLKDGSHFLVGNKIYYDVNTQWGIIENGASKFDQGYYYGEEIRKIDKEIFDVDKGLFTTCNSQHPHFYIQADKLRLYKGDKIVAKPLIFYVNHFPVLALPFGTFTIKRGRKTGILVPSPGYNKVDGKFIENIAFYYAFKEYADLTLYFDYFERTGWETGLKGIYKKRYRYNGDFLASLKKQITGPDNSNYEWHLKYKHHSDFRNNTTLDADLDFVSSKKVWEGSVDIDERLSEKITSKISFKKPLCGSSLRIYSRYTDDFKNEKKDIILPSITFLLPSKPISELFISKDNFDADVWWTNFSYSYNFKGINQGQINDPDANIEDILYKSKKDSVGNYINQHNQGIKQSVRLTYSYKYKGWLYLNQSLYYNEAWFDRDKNDNKYVRGADYYSSSKTSFSLYGLKEIPQFYITAVRHIITPSISYIYQPDFSGNDKFYSFGGINLKNSDRQRKISMSLENKWQLKLFKGKDRGDKKINDFFKIYSTLNYDFEAENKGFSYLNHSLYLKPGTIKHLIMDLSSYPTLKITQNTYDFKIKGNNINDWDFGLENWNFDLKSKISFSQDATYIDYFPESENRFVSNQFFQSDSLDWDQSETISSLEEIDMLKQDRKNWTFSLSHLLKTNKTMFENREFTNDLRTSISAKITKNWFVNYQNYIDLEKQELVSHRITLTRDLHCWKIVFKYVKERSYWSYSFKLFNIQLPDDLKFRTSDHRK